MFLALIVLIAAVVAVAALVTKVIKTVISSSKSSPEGKEGKNEQGEKKENLKKPKDEAPREDKAEAEQQKEEEKESLSEEQTNRFAAARRAGITESFWSEKTDFSIDSKDFADKCVSGSSLSYLEVNNRALAGNDFMGFNVLVEQREKMTLTYQGQAIATLTRQEKTVTKTVDGKEVSENVTFYRTNTFPPHLTSKMVPDDLERMLQASTSIIACNGNPELVSGRILDIFTESGNVDKLKANIDTKIQAKESRLNSVKMITRENKEKPQKTIKQ